MESRRKVLAESGSLLADVTTASPKRLAYCRSQAWMPLAISAVLIKSNVAVEYAGTHSSTALA